MGHRKRWTRSGNDGCPAQLRKVPSVRWGAAADPVAEAGRTGAEDTGEESDDKPKAWPWVETVLDGLSRAGCPLTLAALAAAPASVMVVWQWRRTRDTERVMP